jgi:hypothetical protein
MSSILSSRKYYINSVNRTSGSNQNFQIPIAIPPNSGYDHISVVDASIPLTYYNIDSPYNQFILKEGASQVTVTITPGNYNMRSFMSMLVTLLNTVSPGHFTYSMTFNDVIAKYSYAVTGNAGVQPQFIFTDFLVSQMGFSNHSTNSFSVGVLTSTDVVSFIPNNSLFIHCDLIAADASNILQDIYANNNIPYSFITFSSPNVEHYAKRLSTTNHATINITLQDALGQEVNLNGVDWNLSIILFKKNNLSDMFRNFLNFVVAMFDKNNQSTIVGNDV